jgi:carbamoylphosphate synthase large subunit
MTIPKAKVLITSVGSRVGLGLLESLRPVRDRFAVIGVNSIADAPQNFYCDRAYLAPATAERAAFTGRLRAIIETERPAAVLAGRDEELDCLGALAGDAFFGDVLFLTPCAEVTSICNDKYETWRFAQAHGLPFAESAVDAEGLAQIIARTGYPVIAKRRSGGYASRDVYIVRDDGEAKQALATGRFVFQAFVEPSSASIEIERDLAFGVPWSFQMRDIRYAAEGVVDRNGDVICVSSVVSETSGGPSTRMTVLDDPELEGVHRAYARALAARGLFGPLNLQGKKTAAGTFVPYEINGRFTGSVMARTLQGYNQVVFALDYFLAARLPPPRQQATGSPATILMPVFFAIDPSAASKLKNLGRWDAGEACGTRLGD